MTEYSSAYHDASEFITDPPASLTAAGRAMLEEIYKADPELPVDCDRIFVEITRLASHHGPAAKRLSASKIRSHLLAGGYLDIEETDFPGSDPMCGEYIITAVALTEKAYEALGIKDVG